MIVNEGRTVLMTLQVLLQGDILQSAGTMLRSRPVETKNIKKHRPVVLPEKVLFLCKKSPETVPSVLPAARIVPKAKAHLGRCRQYIEFVEKCLKIRIVPVVVDDESRIDRFGGVPEGDVHGVTVAAQPIAGFVKGHVMLAIQKVTRNHSRDSTSNNRNFHRNIRLLGVNKVTVY